MKAPSRRVAFLTSRGFASLTADEHIAVRAFTARDLEVTPRVWDDEAPITAPFDAALVRSCWDYHEKSEAFLGVLDGLAGDGTRVFNAPEVIRWNIDKLYLRELTSKGATLPQTVWVPRGTSTSLQSLLADNDLDEAVVKPRISLSSVDTFRVTRRDVAGVTPRFVDLVARKDLIIQAFVPEIAQGEVSLIFFGGVYSHAVRKTPKAGDFRVQSDYGGTRARIDPKPEWLAAASKVLAQLPPLVYVRVDVIDTSDGLLWMEVEGTDPELFFELVPEAALRFADAFMARIEG